MLSRSFGVSIAPLEGERGLSGPTTIAGMALLACVFTRLSGLDDAGIPFCYFKALTGRACLTCGATRAFGHLSRFDLEQAFAIQPLVTATTLGFMIWGALDALLFLFSKRTVVRMGGSAPRVILAVGVILAALNWMYLLATGV